MREVTVVLGDRSYPVLVGAGVRHRLLEVLPAGVRKVAIVTQEAVGVIVDVDVEQATFLLDDGEEAKCVESVEQLCRDFVGALQGWVDTILGEVLRPPDKP